VLPPVLLVGALLGAAALDFEFWGLLCPPGMLAEEQCRSEVLDGVGRDVRRRSEAKAAVVWALIDGHLTLFEAAARVRDLDRASPNFQWSEFRRFFKGDSDEERHCREVIRHVWAQLPEDSPKTQELLRRLEAELRDALDHGTLRLPEPRCPAGSDPS